MMTYTGSISEALKLAYTGLATKASYSYYYATALPSYWSGVGLAGYSSSSTISMYYSVAPGDFLAAASSTKSAITPAMAAFESIAKVSFTTGTSISSDIVVSELSKRLYVDGDPNTTGFQGAEVLGFGMPPAAASATTTQKQQASDLFVLPGSHATQDTLSRTTQHELSHTIGLKDASTAGLSAAADNGSFTIMSYNNHLGEGHSVKDLQLYDIAALQSIYGRNDSFNVGNTVINSFVETSGDHIGHDRTYSIWDGGGTDTLDASSLSTGSVIDLRPGYFSSLGPDSAVSVSVTSHLSGGNTIYSPTIVAGSQNISIAYGAYIENAVGSTNNDLIIGNVLSNTISGGAGNDVIFGEGLHASLNPGTGDYSQIINTGSKIAAPPGAVLAFVNDLTRQHDSIDGGAGDDFIVGSSGSDTINGGDGNDKISGGTGNDVIHGGAGDDLLVLGTGGTTAVMTRTGTVLYTDNVKVEGGPGADTFWFAKHSTDAHEVYQNTYADGWGPVSWSVEITDFEAADKIVWNGVTPVGGVLTLVDEEYNTPGYAGNGVRYMLVDYDSNGIMYAYDSGLQALDIRFPDGGRLLIDNWSQGMGGITATDLASLPFYGADQGGQYALEARNDPRTPLVMDGSHASSHVSDFLTLSAIQSSLSHVTPPPMDPFF